MVKTICSLIVVKRDISLCRGLAAFGHRVCVFHYNRSVVCDLDTNDTTVRIAVTVCHGNGHLVGNGLISAFNLMFIRRFGQMEGIVQLACGGIVACDFKVPFICAHM